MSHFRAPQQYLKIGVKTDYSIMLATVEVLIEVLLALSALFAVIARMLEKACP